MLQKSSEKSIPISGFPTEFIDDSYNAFKLISKDFRHFLDWGHYCENFLIRETATGNVVYQFDEGMFDLKNKNTENIKRQLKFIQWVDNHHLALLDIDDKDSIC